MFMTKNDFVRFIESLPEDSLIEMTGNVTAPEQNNYIWEDMKVRQTIPLPQKTVLNMNLIIKFINVDKILELGYY